MSDSTSSDSMNTPSREDSSISTAPGQASLDFSTPQPVTTIMVDQGSNQQTFVIHKHLLSHYSPFFNEAFAKSTEGDEQKQSMVLEDIDARIFGLFVHWLYTQTRKKSQVHSPPLIEWAKFYSLADRFKIPRLANSLFVEVGWLGPSDDPHSGNTLHDFQFYAYSIHGNAALKELAVAKTMEVFLGSKLKRLDEFMEALPSGMLADFMKEMSRRWLRDRLELDEAKEQLKQYQREQPRPRR